MMHFFEVYKMLEHKSTTVRSIMGRESAESIIEKSMAEYSRMREELQ